MSCRASAIWRLGCVLAALGLLLSVGCDSSKTPGPPTGNTLEGKITINQKTPMPQGMVYLFNSSGRDPVARARIKSDGTYSTRNAPVGEVQLVVTFDTSPRPAPQVTGADYNPGRQERRPPPAANHADGKSASESAKPATPGGLDQKLIDALELKYGSLFGEGRIIHVVAEGHNTFDINLTVP